MTRTNAKPTGRNYAAPTLIEYRVAIERGYAASETWPGGPSEPLDPLSFDSFSDEY